MKLTVLLSLLSFLVLMADKGRAEPADEEINRVMESGAPALTPEAMPQGRPVKLSASLINAEANAREKSATVQVKAIGIDIVDPASSNEKAKMGQGHIHYQLDNGVVVATTATKLSFHNLTAGRHKIVIKIAGNNHKPLGPQQTLWVTVPQS